MAYIHSVHNPRVKRAVRLRDRRQRMRQGRFVIDGGRELLRALAAGIEIEEAFVCEARCRTPEAQAALSLLAERFPQARFDVPPAVLEKLAYGERDEGLVAVAIAPPLELDRIAVDQGTALVILESVEKPGNVGAVARTADAAGMTGLIVTGDGATDLYNPNAVRASLGALFAVPLAAAPANEVLAWLKEAGIAIFAARVEGSQVYTQADFRGPCAIVLGSEARGLSSIWQGEGVTAVRLPMRGVGDSLNVSATAAVLCYEVLRQRSD